ncbi:hypothetical protein [Acidisoma silvae]
MDGRRFREAVTLSMQVKGKRPIEHLIARLTEVEGVLRVATTSDGEDLE